MYVYTWIYCLGRPLYEALKANAFPVDGGGKRNIMFTICVHITNNEKDPCINGNVLPSKQTV